MLRNVPLAVCFPDLCTTNILVASNLLCRLNQAALKTQGPGEANIIHIYLCNDNTTFQNKLYGFCTASISFVWIIFTGLFNPTIFSNSALREAKDNAIFRC